MSRHILLEESPFGVRALVQEGGKTIRLAHHVFGRQAPQLGAVIEGRAGPRDRRLGLQLIDLGAQGEGWLPVKERQHPEGSKVFVAIRREAVGDKRPLLTDRPSLHLPAATLDGRTGNVRSGPLGEIPLPPSFDKNLQAASKVEPALLLLAQLVSRETERVLLSSGSLKARLAPFMPDPDLLVVDEAISSDLDHAEDAALARTEPLQGGGRLVIDETEALTTVDVDLGSGEGQSARGAGDSLRQRFLDELAPALAARAIGGQVVLDLPRFAIRQPKPLRDQITAALKPTGLSSIPAVTKEGLVVLVLQKTGPSLLDRLTMAHSLSDGVRPGRVMRPDITDWRAFTEASRTLAAQRTQSFVLALDPDALRIWQKRDADAALASRFGARLRTAARRERGYLISNEAP
ncbi:MAG: ribonuclease E/G [Parvularcula sp.]|jgi:hypothetical protein|nr:ribonuclease E/G [Parvularcula sp.]